MLAVPPFASKALPVAPVSAPPLIVNVPSRIPAPLVRAILFVPPLEVTEPNVAFKLPFVSESAWPVVLTIISAAFNVPKSEPEIALLLELPPVKPASQLSRFSVTPLPPALVMVVAGAPVFMLGKDALPLGVVKPEIAVSEVLASCPINFCPFRSVIPPGYAVALS